MVARLFISSSKDLRSQKIDLLVKEHNLTKNHPDLLWIAGEEAVGIEQAKKMRGFLSLKPYSSKFKLVVIEDAEKLTLDAQNSLLKTFEEPPDNSLIFMGIKEESNLLPTILSRLAIEYLDKNVKEEGLSPKTVGDIENLLNAGLQQRFMFIENLQNREDFLKSLILFFRNKLLEEKYLEFNKDLLEAAKWAKANVNIRIILEYLMLKMPSS